MNKLALAKLIANAGSKDFSAMTKPQFGSWIDGLPADEFIELLSAHDEFARTGQFEQPDIEFQAAPGDNDWTPYAGDGEPPIEDDALCFTLYPDGGVEGPNRADAFLWGDQGSAQIIAWAPAQLAEQSHG
jgi:hypothetical protein